MGFNGERRDFSIESDFLGQGRRAYSPVLMRFLSADALSPFYEGGLNAYSYCEGDPVNYSDPSAMNRWATIVRQKVFASGRRAELKRKLPLQEQALDLSVTARSGKKKYIGDCTRKKFDRSEPPPVSIDYWWKNKRSSGDAEKLASLMVDSYKAGAANSARGVPSGALKSAIAYRFETGGGGLSGWPGLDEFVDSTSYKNRHTAITALYRNINRVVRRAVDIPASQIRTD